jgi:hypothetical protein
VEKITRFDTFFALGYSCCTILVDEGSHVYPQSFAGVINDERTASILKLVKHSSEKNFSLKLYVYNPLTVSGLIFTENLHNYYGFVLGCIELELKYMFKSRVSTVTCDDLCNVYKFTRVYKPSQDVEKIHSIFNLYDMKLCVE